MTCLHFSCLPDADTAELQVNLSDQGVNPISLSGNLLHQLSGACIANADRINDRIVLSQSINDPHTLTRNLSVREEVKDVRCKLECSHQRCLWFRVTVRMDVEGPVHNTLAVSNCGVN